MKNIIPPHQDGKKLDCFDTIEFASPAEAQAFYGVARQRLLHVQRWAAITDIPSATFRLLDSQNQEPDRPAAVGDFIRIDIPGPGLPSSNGYDWVRVEAVDEDTADDYQRTVLTLRPAPDPTNQNTDTAHFFTNLATSTLIVEQRSNVVTAQYAGRNEHVNTENQAVADNLRNFLVGLTAKMGASFPQWKSLVVAIVKPEDKSRN